ncbi:MAG: fumarate reductase/succinate dehydrogenase flavoprotein subunit, partial [Propionibacteriaceae bacterium]|nr:fumarate reductase/succinate dehydrogenase flavoprotein subunit [Propionibacteriaceae bacterium]
LPNTINDYLASGPYEKLADDDPAVVEAVDAVKERIDKLLSINGERTVDSIHKELGHIMWEYCGMERKEAGLITAIQKIRDLREEFYRDVQVTGVNEDVNQPLERAGRLADFFELGELMCIDALHRRESCGGHFRAESQTEDGEALRDDEHFLYVGAWEYGADKPILHREPLIYTAIELKQRSYK